MFSPLYKWRFVFDKWFICFKKDKVFDFSLTNAKPTSSRELERRGAVFAVFELHWHCQAFYLYISNSIHQRLTYFNQRIKESVVKVLNKSISVNHGFVQL